MLSLNLVTHPPIWNSWSDKGLLQKLGFHDDRKGGINQVHATGLLLYLLKTSENQKFPGVFREYIKKPVAWNRGYIWHPLSLSKKLEEKT